MAKKNLTEIQRKADLDISIIFVVTGIVFGIFTVFQKDITTFIKNNNIHILVRTLISALFQFGLAGLGITIVSVFRKESFIAYGLKFKSTVLSILLSVACFVPYIVFLFVTNQAESYFPLSVWVTEEVLASGFPINVIGMTLISIAWGFFEGFNYVVISDKINKRYPSKNKWLNWGAIACAVLCILIHGAIGVTAEGMIEMITILFFVYGMLMVKEFTGNAWGSVFVFVFLWNAF